MASAGLRPRSPASDRQALGLFSLGIGVVLFLLIGLRALQAHRDGDQQLRNDSLWVLVSPLVFGGFGLRLITATPAAGRQPRSDLEPARQALEQAEALAERSRQAAQGQGQRQLEAQLQQARAELDASRSASRRLEQQLQQSIRAGEARAAALEHQLAALQQQRQQLGEALDQWRRAPTEAPSPDPLAPVATALETRASALESRVAELDAAHRALQLQHHAALQQLQERLQQETQEQIRQHIAAFSGRWQAPLEEGQTRLIELRSDVREQWQALEAELAGARREQQAAQEQRHRHTRQLEQQLEQQLSDLAGEVRQLEQGQQGLQQQLARSTGSAEQQQDQLEQRVAAAATTAERASTSLRQHLKQLQGERDGLCRTTAELAQLITRLESASALGDGAAPGLEGSYNAACAELGVLPGSPWTAVRATWRQGLLRWHPDQGGDASLWARRQAAYQLLEAWYAFRQPPG